MPRGFFITLEGGEGAGKSTLARNLQTSLETLGRKVMITREPGGTHFSEKMREIILKRTYGEIETMSELLLFLAARVEHVEKVIKPAINEGKVVICDRFTDSTVAYQGYAAGLGVDYVQEISNKVLQGFEPDLTFYLDIHPEFGLGRTAERRANTNEEIDIMEQKRIDFHLKVREGFLELAKKYPRRIIVLDAALDRGTLSQLAQDELFRRL